MIIDVNLNEVKEKPSLPEATALTFSFEKVELVQAKEANKKSGQREWMIKGTLQPLEPEWQDKRVWHNWVITPGSLESDDPLFSIRKFFEVTGTKWGTDGRFSTEDVAQIKFIGTAGYHIFNGKRQVHLASVLKGA